MGICHGGPICHMTIGSRPYDYIVALVYSDLMTWAVSKPKCFATHLYTVLMDYDHMPIMPYHTFPYIPYETRVICPYDYMVQTV